VGYLRWVPEPPNVIVQVPRGGQLDRQLTADAPPSVASGRAVIERAATDPEGRLEAARAGQVVLSVPSPEGLEREADTVRRVIGQAGIGVEPLVVVVESAEELREEELSAVIDAARHTSRPVILRIIGDG
jgi:hypothetical protein